MIEGGKILHWSGVDWPLTVYVASGPGGHVMNAVRLINAIGRRLYQYPVEPIRELVALWARDPKKDLWPRRSVLVEINDSLEVPGRTIHEFDPATGLVNSAKVMLRSGAPLAVVLHEMLHVLTVGHSSDVRSVMYYNQAVPGEILAADARTVKDVGEGR